MPTHLFLPNTPPLRTAPFTVRHLEVNKVLLVPRLLAVKPNSFLFCKGTRVIYDRSTLLALSNSQLAKTPPSKMMYVAGVTKASDGSFEDGKKASTLHPNAAAYRKASEVKREEEEKKKTCKWMVKRVLKANRLNEWCFRQPVRGVERWYGRRVWDGRLRHPARPAFFPHHAPPTQRHTHAYIYDETNYISACFCYPFQWVLI